MLYIRVHIEDTTTGLYKTDPELDPRKTRVLIIEHRLHPGTVNLVGRAADVRAVLEGPDFVLRTFLTGSVTSFIDNFAEPVDADIFEMLRDTWLTLHPQDD
jgi:hypothetical protein